MGRLPGVAVFGQGQEINGQFGALIGGRLRRFSLLQETTGTVQGVGRRIGNLRRKRGRILLDKKTPIYAAFVIQRLTSSLVPNLDEAIPLRMT